MTQLKAFIFDLDGVITDTARYHYLAWKRLACEEGISFTPQENEQLRGVSRRRSLEILLKGKEVPEDRKLEMMERKNRYYLELIATISPKDLLPGAKELLITLKEGGFKVALASASKNAGLVIAKLGIEKLFDAVSHGYSVERAKPAPDLFLHSAGQLKTAPEFCAVVEDAEAGIEGALAAGMTVVGIGPPERVGKAHYRYDTIAQVNLVEILGYHPATPKRE